MKQDKLVYLVHPGQLDQQDSQEKQVTEEVLESQDPSGQEVSQEREEMLEQKESLVNRARMVNLECLAQ